MNISIVGYFGWYGSMAEWVASGFEGNGHTITKIDRKQLSPQTVFDTSLVVYVDCSEDYSSSMPTTDKITVFWSLDTQMPGGAERSVNIARKCDLTFSSNYEYGVKTLEKFGVESVLMPITYSDKLILHRGGIDKRYDVVMIGHPNSLERIRLWEMLNARYKCKLGKAEYKNEYIDWMENARVIINQPTEPWDIILNNRFFEGLATTGALLQKRLRTTLIEKLGFENLKDFLYWEKIEDIPELVDFVLNGGAPQIKGVNPKVQKYSMSAQCAKMEAIILSKFYDRL